MIGQPIEQPNEAFALVNGRVVLPDEVAAGKAVIVEGTTIRGVADSASLSPNLPTIDVHGRIITPGLIDIHTHGAVGHSFQETTETAFGAIAQENVTRGVTSILGTVTTASIADMLHSAEFCRQWMRTSHEGARMVGIHLEGPYFSEEQKGAQDPKHLRTPDDGSADLLLRNPDAIRIMTFAPELPGAIELTRRLVELGIVPAAGHSSARDENVLRAMEAGLSHIIHIWSSQSTMVREGPWRKPGLLEATLTFDGFTAEMITDNRHLPATLMKLAYKCLGPDRLCAISDATNGTGMPEGTRFKMGELEYVVHDGVAMTLDGASFAGSTTLLNQMVPILTDVVGIPLAEAIRMTSLTPARVIGMAAEKGSLEAGKDADIAIFDDDFTAWRTMIAGQWAYARHNAQ